MLLTHVPRRSQILDVYMPKLHLFDLLWIQVLQQIHDKSTTNRISGVWAIPNTVMYRYGPTPS